MTKSYEVCVVKDNVVIVFMVAYTKKQAKAKLKMLRRMYPDCSIQIYERENEEAA